MLFSLWGPKKNSAIVRIYAEGTDAYIWRKSKKHTLQISGADEHLEESIRNSLLNYGIDIDKHHTRRSLAKALHTKGLLVGGYRKYISSFNETSVHTAKIFNFADFKRDR